MWVLSSVPSVQQGMVFTCWLCPRSELPPMLLLKPPVFCLVFKNKIHIQIMSISCVLSVSWSKSFVGVRCSLLMNCSDERDCDHSDGSNFLSVFYLYIWFWRNIGISWKFRMQEEVSISWWPYSISSHSDSRIPVDKQCSLAWSVILLGHPYMSSDDPNLFEHLLVSQIWNFFKEFSWGAFPLVRLKEILPKTLFNKISVVGRLLSPNPMEWQLSVIHFPNTVVFLYIFM